MPKSVRHQVRKAQPAFQHPLPVDLETVVRPNAAVLEIEFANRRLESCYESLRDATRAWGLRVGRAYIVRVQFLAQAATLHDVRQMRSLRFHQLTGKRSGQFALDLGERWRLIVTFHEPGTIRVEEVSNHYDD